MVHDWWPARILSTADKNQTKPQLIILSRNIQKNLWTQTKTQRNLVHKWVSQQPDTVMNLTRWPDNALTTVEIGNAFRSAIFIDENE